MRTKALVVLMIIFGVMCKAQDDNFGNVLAKIKSNLQKLHPNSDKLFFNYGFVMQNDLEEWHNTKTIFASTNKWLGIYNSIDNSYTTLNPT